jgi:microcystin degradation protein MlrC
MTVIRELIRHGVADVAVAAVWDPEAVARMREAGPGATLTLDLGGKTAMPSIGAEAEPLTLTGKVRSLSDGEWIVRGPMYTGARVTDRADGRVRRGRPADRRHLPPPRALGHGDLHRERHRPAPPPVPLLKSRIHYRAGFAPLAKATITLDGVGVTTSDNAVLRYDRLERPIYPLDPDAEWRPA